MVGGDLNGRGMVGGKEEAAGGCAEGSRGRKWTLRKCQLGRHWDNTIRTGLFCDCSKAPGASVFCAAGDAESHVTLDVLLPLCKTPVCECANSSPLHVSSRPKDALVTPLMISPGQECVLLLKPISRWNSNLLMLRYESHEQRVLALTGTRLTLLSFTFLLVLQIKYPHVSRRCIKFLLFAVRGRSSILVVGMKPGYLSVLLAASMNTLSLLSSMGTYNPADVTENVSSVDLNPLLSSLAWPSSAGKQPWLK